MAATEPTLVVTGASGKLGQLIVAHLRRLYAGPIVATSRSPDKLATLPGVQARHADFDEPATLDRAFSGGTRLLIVSTDAHEEPGRRLRQHRNAIAAARRAGVAHVVYTSLTRPEPGSPMKIAPDHYQTEQALADSPLGWTVLRNNLYAELLLEFLPQAVRNGKLFAAAGEGAVSWVARDDVAHAAAACLSHPPEGHRILDVTGPEALSYEQLTQVAGAVSGRGPIRYVAMGAQEMAGNLSAAGLPPHVVDVLLGFQLAAARGDLAVATPVVQDLTGRPPATVHQFLSAHRAALQAGLSLAPGVHP